MLSYCGGPINYDIIFAIFQIKRPLYVLVFVSTSLGFFRDDVSLMWAYEDRKYNRTDSRRSVRRR